MSDSLPERRSGKAKARQNGPSGPFCIAEAEMATGQFRGPPGGKGVFIA